MKLLWSVILSLFVNVGAIETLSYEDLIDLHHLLNRADVRNELSIPLKGTSLWDVDDRKIRQLEESDRSSSAKATLQEREASQRQILLEQFRLACRTLTPDQLQRLYELHVQYKAFKSRTPTALEQVVELSAEQKAALQDGEEELGKELRDMLFRFNRTADRELSEILTPQQRAEWQEKVGGEFEFQMTYRGLAPLSVLLTGRAYFQFPGNPDRFDDNDLIRRADVGKELELLDDQLAELKQADPKFRKLTREMKIRHTEAVARADIEAKLRLSQEHVLEVFSLLGEWQRAQLELREQVLLPHQLKRLIELRWQYRAIRDRVAALDQALKLTDEQLSRLRQKENELSGEMINAMWAFHGRSQKLILEVLTPEQLTAWKRATGEDFKFHGTDPGLQILRCLL